MSKVRCGFRGDMSTSPGRAHQEFAMFHDPPADVLPPSLASQLQTLVYLYDIADSGAWFSVRECRDGRGNDTAAFGKLGCKSLHYGAAALGSAQRSCPPTVQEPVAQSLPKHRQFAYAGDVVVQLAIALAGVGEAGAPDERVNLFDHGVRGDLRRQRVDDVVETSQEFPCNVATNSGHGACTGGVLPSLWQSITFVAFLFQGVSARLWFRPTLWMAGQTNHGKGAGFGER